MLEREEDYLVMGPSYLSTLEIDKMEEDLLLRLLVMVFGR